MYTGPLPTQERRIRPTAPNAGQSIHEAKNFDRVAFFCDKWHILRGRKLSPFSNKCRTYTLGPENHGAQNSFYRESHNLENRTVLCARKPIGNSGVQIKL